VTKAFYLRLLDKGKAKKVALVACNDEVGGERIWNLCSRFAWYTGTKSFPIAPSGNTGNIGGDTNKDTI
jgi:hypothetical protein